MTIREPKPTTKLKYLLVDDHAGFRNLLKQFIPGEHGTILECSNGEEAVELYRAAQPDWTIMDIDMPVKNGLQAAIEILQEDPEARIVFVSQHDSEDFRAQARSAGGQAYISKDHLSELTAFVS